MKNLVAECGPVLAQAIPPHAQSLCQHQPSMCRDACSSNMGLYAVGTYYTQVGIQARLPHRVWRTRWGGAQIFYAVLKQADMQA